MSAYLVCYDDDKSNPVYRHLENFLNMESINATRPLQGTWNVEIIGTTAEALAEDCANIIDAGVVVAEIMTLAESGF